MNILKTYGRICEFAVGRVVKEELFSDYEPAFNRAGTSFTFHEYICLLVVSPVIACVLAFLLLFTQELILRLLLTLLAGISVFFMIYLYPYERTEFRKRKMDAELPLALNYTASLLGSGATPVVAFSMLSEFEEFDEVSKQTQRIIRDIKVLGMDLPQALDTEAKACPSQKFREILLSLRSEIIAGGNLTAFFEEKAKETMGDYSRKQEEYKESSVTLASIYTVVSLVAPMIFMMMVVMINFIGAGGIQASMTELILTLGIFAGIPLLNLAFLAIIKITQPEIL
jgi:flagellar protein FlaJ